MSIILPKIGMIFATLNRDYGWKMALICVIIIFLIVGTIEFINEREKKKKNSNC